jgi:hypothetical protein
MAGELNPTLFRLLRRRFGEVRVANPGVPFVEGPPGRDLVHGRVIRRIDERGETYKVCCPFCGDTRFRLFVNHTWGVRRPDGGRGLALAKCFNEDCLYRRENREALLEDLTAPGDPLAAPRLRRPKERPPAKPELPGECVPLSELPEGHPALDYLRSRHFDPDEVGRDYGVLWCEEALYRYRLASRRLVVPVTHDGKLVSWQARHPGDLDWKARGAPPKYYTMPGSALGRYAYNLDAASRYRALVVCEGVTDVWAFGPMAVALFGAFKGGERVRLVGSAAAASGAPVVLLLDPDKAGQGAVAALADDLAARLGPGRVARVLLPDPGRDPADYDREFLHGFVAGEALAQGVTVSFKKKRRHRT